MMAATFDQLVTISKDAGFQGRCQYAATVAAINVYNEVPSTQNHLIRAALATRILSGTYNFNGFVWGVLTNSTVASEADPSATPDFAIPDGDIQFQINSIWNAVAGA